MTSLRVSFRAPSTLDPEAFPRQVLANVLSRLPSREVARVTLGRGKGGPVAFRWQTPRRTDVAALALYPDDDGDQLEWNIWLWEFATPLVFRLVRFRSPKVDVSLEEVRTAVQAELAEDTRCTAICWDREGGPSEKGHID
jgi:hypothetical protein